MKYLFLTLTIVLAGCQEQSKQSVDKDLCNGYGCTYQSTTRLGIQFRDDMGDSPRIAPTHEEIDEAYKDISYCFGAWEDPSDIMVVVVPELLDKPPEVNGTYYGNSDGGSPLIAIEGSAFYSVREYVLRHEFVHHYLLRTTGASDSNHNSPMWDICLGGE